MRSIWPRLSVSRIGVPILGCALAAALVVTVPTPPGAIAPNGPKASSAGYPVGGRISAWSGGHPACDVFVSPSGRGRYRGRSRRFPASLSAAASRARADQVICLEAGTYAVRSNVILSRSGSPHHPIVYRADGGRVLLQYVGRSLAGGVLQTASGDDWSGTHDIVIEGLTIDGADVIGGGIFVTRGSHHVTIENCLIRNTGATGIGLQATDYVTVQHNVIYHTGYNQGWSSGISLWYGGTSPTYGGPSAWYDHRSGFHNIVASNIVSGAYDNSAYRSEGNGIIVDGSGRIPPVLIENNLTYENAGNGIEVYDNSGDAWVVNNTAYADGLDLSIGLGLASEFLVVDATNVHLVNDLAYGRENGLTYHSAYLYTVRRSGVVWARDFGYRGSNIGLSPAVLRDRRRYRYTNPRFLTLPPIPGGARPWTNGVVPWHLSGEFALLAESPARRAGIDPLAIHGVSRSIATGIAHFAADLPTGTTARRAG